MALLLGASLHWMPSETLPDGHFVQLVDPTLFEYSLFSLSLQDLQFLEFGASAYFPTSQS
jgi:hypothetical protein